MSDAREIAAALEGWGHAHGWAGSDPYDGLNATRLTGLLQRGALGRRIVTQAVKRSPLNLRPLLGIPPGVSAVSLALAASAYARGDLLDRATADERLRATLTQLGQLRCAGFEQPCWGYHFDVQTAVLRYPAGSPNTIATVFAGLAHVDGYEALGDPALLDVAEAAGEFFLTHVPQTPDEPGAYFGYLAGDRTPIHNASMLVCALLARVAAHRSRADFLAAAAAGVAYTVARQRPDGSWPYGEQPHTQWVDGFHTGYVLDCLLDCHALPGAAGAHAQGIAYYRRELVLPDGTPKYYAGEVFPIDALCVAQAIQTFARSGGEALADAQRVLAFAQRRMRRSDGLFAFQRRRWWRNAAPHVRWVQAPMLLALVELDRAEAATGGSGRVGDDGVDEHLERPLA